jgi:DNA-binding NarL/FixJ family response regulator
MPKKNVFRDFKRHKIMRLIIADDSDVLRSRLVEMLREVKGIDIVGEAKDSEETLAAVNSLRPDVIILDLRMPREEGILALEAIKDIKRKCPIVIIFTNFPYLQYRKRCLDAGADFFFYKAVEFEKLLELMKHLARRI